MSIQFFLLLLKAIDNFLCKSLRKEVIFNLLFFILFSFNSFAGIKTSAGSGNWNAASSWIPSGSPVNGDSVIIAAGHTITYNTNPVVLAGLTINGVLILGNNNTDRNISINGDLIINNGGIFNTAGNGGNSVSVTGNLINNGVFNMKIGTASANVTFGGNINQQVIGTGLVTNFNFITVNNSGLTSNNIVEISSSNFSAASGFLTLTKGILKMSGTYSFSNSFFNTANPTINADEGIWLNNQNITVTGQAGDTRLYGLIRITSGTYNIGSGADWWLNYYTGSKIIIEGGALNISGAFFGGLSTSAITFTQTGGDVTVNTAGNNFNVASFEIRAPASVFTMSGGKIILQKAATTYTDYINYSANSTISGGKIQAGNSQTPVSSVFWINSTPVVYDLEVKLYNNPFVQLRSNTTILNDVIIGGVLDAATNNVDLNVGHD